MAHGASRTPARCFPLQAWAKVLPTSRFIGVYRPSTAIAASIEARNSFTERQSLDIAVAYNERLASLQRHLGFPVVNFDLAPNDLIARIREVIEALGLEWTPAADDLFDDRLVHHGRHDQDAGEQDVYLGLAAQEPVSTIKAHSATAVVRANRNVDQQLAAALPRHLGPSFAARRASAAARCRDGRRGAAWLEILPDDAPPLEGLPGIGPIDAVDLGAWPIRLNPDRPYSHVLATDILDYLQPNDLLDFFHAIGDVSGTSTRLVIGGRLIETNDQSPRVWSDLAATGTGGFPHAHLIDAIVAAATDAGWYLMPLELGDSSRDLALVRKPVSEQHEFDPHPVVRRRLEEAESALLDAATSHRELEDRLAVADRDLGTAAEHGARLAHELEVARERFAARESEIETLRTEMSSVSGRLASVARERDQARNAATEARKKEAAAKAAHQRTADQPRIGDDHVRPPERTQIGAARPGIVRAGPPPLQSDPRCEASQTTGRRPRTARDFERSGAPRCGGTCERNRVAAEPPTPEQARGHSDRGPRVATRSYVGTAREHPRRYQRWVAPPGTAVRRSTAQDVVPKFRGHRRRQRLHRWDPRVPGEGPWIPNPGRRER